MRMEKCWCGRWSEGGRKCQLMAIVIPAKAGIQKKIETPVVLK